MSKQHTKPRLAIIGAGLAGLTLAHKWRDSFDITVFEKSRGTGGRMATRYAAPYQFDHGAQYFTARSDAFQDFLAPHIKAGHVKAWDGRAVILQTDKMPEPQEWDEPHYVGAPKMNSLCKALANKQNVHYRTRVSDLIRDNGAWTLATTDGDRHGPFDSVVSTAPAPQTLALLPPNFKHSGLIKRARMSGCFTLMLGFEEPLYTNWDCGVVKNDNSPLSWIAVNSHKPDRDTAPSVVVHSKNNWAENRLDDDPAEIERVMKEALVSLTDLDPEKAAHSRLHRWRFANVEDAAGQDYLWDDALNIGACGDWCIASRVEAAFTSACSLSSKLIL